MRIPKNPNRPPSFPDTKRTIAAKAIVHLRDALRESERKGDALRVALVERTQERDEAIEARRVAHLNLDLALRRADDLQTELAFARMPKKDA